MNGYDQSGAAFLSSAKEFFRNLISWLGEEESEAEHPGVVTGTGAAATSEHVNPVRTAPVDKNTVDAGPGNNNIAPPQVPQQPQVKTYLHRESTPQVATDPPVSEAQRRAMFAAKEGHSNLGIPKSVGSEFAASDPGGHLPEQKSKDEEPGNGTTGGPPGPWYDPSTQEQTDGPAGGIAKPGESNIADRFETSPDGTQVRNNETGEIFVRVDDVQDEAPSGWGSPRFDEVEADDAWSPEAREAAAKARQNQRLDRAPHPSKLSGMSSLDPRMRREAIANQRYANRGEAPPAWHSPKFSRDAWSPEARAAAAASRKQRGGVERTPSTPATSNTAKTVVQHYNRMKQRGLVSGQQAAQVAVRGYKHLTSPAVKSGTWQSKSWR